MAFFNQSPYVKITFRSPTKLLLLALTLSSCASLEERLCNQTTAFQKGYDDVINGRQGSPGLKEGEACKKSEKFAYADFHRDYMAGFNKAKINHCSSSNASKIGQKDAATHKEFRASLNTLAVCIADADIKVNLESFYEVAFRKEFCQPFRAKSLGAKDAQNFGDKKNTEETFELCAYQKKELYKSYLASYAENIKVQCTPARAASLASQNAREKKALSEGLLLLEKCPGTLSSSLASVYSSAYQSERTNMLEEERIRMEQERLNREEANQQELLRIKRKQLELEEQKYKNPNPI
ncbi:MAG: hypothetical protein R3A80_01220 [Bdellovibrionota bacterium]